MNVTLLQACPSSPRSPVYLTVSPRSLDIEHAARRRRPPRVPVHRDCPRPGEITSAAFLVLCATCGRIPVANAAVVAECRHATRTISLLRAIAGCVWFELGMLAGGGSASGREAGLPSADQSAGRTSRFSTPQRFHGGVPEKMGTSPKRPRLSQREQERRGSSGVVFWCPPTPNATEV